MYRTARLCNLADSIPRNRYLGSLDVYKFWIWYLFLSCLISVQESILGILKRLQTLALAPVSELLDLCAGIDSWTP